MRNSMFTLVLVFWGFVGCEKVDMPYYRGKETDFDTYSGYLETINGNLFYMFYESSNDSVHDPVVLWLNGGPGCSSLIGAFMENGPYHPYTMDYNQNIYVEYNTYSWNNIGNMLYIESPPCVGFSYPHSGNCSKFFTDDNQTKYDNYYAIQSFFNQFPQYINNEFYITGESYAGHYIPQLTSLIIDENNNINNSLSNNTYINIKGIAIGNPSINRTADHLIGRFKTALINGMISSEQYNALVEICADVDTHSCWNASNIYLKSQNNNVGSIINLYDFNVRKKCNHRSKQATKLLRFIYNSDEYELNLENNNVDSFPYSPCTDTFKEYLNDIQVQKALHVNISFMERKINDNNGSWNECSDLISDNYNKSLPNEQSKYIRYILNNSDINILIYSGNNDLICPY